MQPNILFIMSDQLAPALTGAYGHSVVKTPSLDRLVADGVRYDAAYSSCPLCAPARASLMAGRQASDIKAYDNAALLPADEPTFAHYLTNAGYECVLSGKMHFIGPDQLHGFKKRLTTDIYPSDFSWTRSREWAGNTIFVPDRLAPGYLVSKGDNLEGLGERRWNRYLEYDVRSNTRAIEYLRRQRISDKYDSKGAFAHGHRNHHPFFLGVSYHHPHQPFHVPRRFWEMYEGVDIPIPEIPEDIEKHRSQLDEWLRFSHGLNKVDVTHPENLKVMHRAYYGLVSFVDHLVGELLDELEEQGLADNTVVMFTSDHGDMLGARGMIQKRCFYEQSARVPMILRLPDGRGAGVKVKEPVSLVDILPTCTELAGFPDELTAPYDGVSLLKYIDDRDDSIEERIVFSESHSDGVWAPCFMARSNRYKYIYIHGHDSQLFDMESDPDEMNNLVGSPEFADIEANLRAAVLSRFDPDAIEEDVQANVKRRLIIEAAMKLNETAWDYTFLEEGRTLYRRHKEPAPEAESRVMKDVKFG